jgi:hypothetical protein
VWVIAITGSGDAFCSGLDLGGPGPDASPLSPQGQLLDDISCDLIAQRSPVTTRLTKRGVTRATAIGLEAQVRFELADIRRAFASQGAQEARRAFFEKRTEVFHGRCRARRRRARGARPGQPSRHRGALAPRPADDHRRLAGQAEAIEARHARRAGWIISNVMSSGSKK